MPCPINGASLSALASVFSTGIINSFLPLVMARVAGVVFHGQAPLAPQQMIAQHPEVLNKGPKINSLVLLCLAIPAVMTAAQPLRLLPTPIT